MPQIANLGLFTKPSKVVSRKFFMERIYHLQLKREMLKGARFALLTGNPQRVEKIAKFYDPQARHLSITISTGIGGPSTAIVIEELAKLGIDTFIRLGTSGAIQKFIKLPDLIITTGSVRLDGTSTHYAPIEYPAVANYEIVSALIHAADALSIPYHVGITASTDSFYPGQERYESFSGYVIKNFQGTLQEWQKLGVLNYEMESATLFTICNALRLRVGCVTCAIVNRVVKNKDQIQQKTLALAEEIIAKAGIEALRQLFSTTS